MTGELLRVALSNALLAALLAALVAAVGGRLRWPAAVHLLWLAVLLRMLMPPLLPVPLLPAVGPAAEGVVTLEGGALAPGGPPGTSALEALDVLGTAWLVGAAGVLLLATTRVVRLRRTLAGARPASRELAWRLEGLAAEMRVRPPRLLLVDERVPPMLWGLGGPRLVLPEGLVGGLAPAQLDVLLAHELAHLARRDHWVRWLELVVTVLFWWNPVTWWAAARLRQAEERCCDALVLRRLPGHARAYADTLVAALKYLALRRPVVPTGAVCMADLSEIQRRLEMILKPTSRRPSVVLAGLLALVVGSALAVTPLLAAPERPDRDDLPVSFAEPITLHLQEADIKDVLRLFAQLTGTQVVIHPDVDGRVTVELADVPASEALDTVLRINGLGWRVHGDTLEVFRTSPAPGELTVLRSGTVNEDGATGRPAPMLAGQLHGDPVYQFDETRISEPRRISAPPPVYPEGARDEGVEGFVILNALIDAQGRVTDVTILRSPDDRLSRAAMVAVLHWVFEPAMMDGTPVAVRYVLTVRFTLD